MDVPVAASSVPLHPFTRHKKGNASTFKREKLVLSWYIHAAWTHRWCCSFPSVQALMEGWCEADCRLSAGSTCRKGQDIHCHGFVYNSFVACFSVQTLCTVVVKFFILKQGGLYKLLMDEWTRVYQNRRLNSPNICILLLKIEWLFWYTFATETVFTDSTLVVITWKFWIFW